MKVLSEFQSWDYNISAKFFSFYVTDNIDLINIKEKKICSNKIVIYSAINLPLD